MKYLKFIAPVFLLFIVNNSFATVGDKFPELTGESLESKTVKLPLAAKGKYCLIGMASSKKAEQDLKTWMQPVYDMFINQNTFIPVDYDVNIYFIPMFSGVNKAGYNSVKKKTKKELDSQLQPFVLFYKGSLEAYKNALNIEDKSKPYFFVLDQNGKIVYATSGKYTSKKLDKIESFVSE